MKRIAVVGGGAAGLLVVVALRQRGLAVDWYGDSEHPGAGLAYGAAAGGRRLNSRADRMGIAESAPGHFADWLGLQGDRRHMFAARAVYGEYLRGQAEQLVAVDREWLSYQCRRIVEIHACGDGYQLRCGSGAQFQADSCVLALGLPMCGQPAWVDDAAWSHPGYLQDPLCGDALTQVRRAASVVALGTGLSMVDAVIDLLASGHTGPITALSRHGLLPAAHVVAPAAADGRWCDELLSTGRVRLRQLLRRMRDEMAQGADWRALIDGLRERSQRVWNALDQADQQRFQRHLAAWWNTRRHRSPADIAARIAEAQQSGQLQVRSARILRVSSVESGLRVHVHGQGQQHTLEADAVLHCLGPDLRVRRHPDPLLQQLLRSGLVSPHASGVGLAAQTGQRLLAADAGQSSGLYALGGLLRGVDPDQTAVAELRAAANSIARCIAGQRINPPA